MGSPTAAASSPKATAFPVVDFAAAGPSVVSGAGLSTHSDIDSQSNLTSLVSIVVLGKSEADVASVEKLCSQINLASLYAVVFEEANLKEFEKGVQSLLPKLSASAATALKTIAFVGESKSLEKALVAPPHSLEPQVAQKISQTSFNLCHQLGHQLAAIQKLVQKSAEAKKWYVLGAELAKLVNVFEENYENIFGMCTKILIELSQQSDWEKNGPIFLGIDKYLAKPEYAFVHDNAHQTTTKLHKAAAFYFLRGLESKNADIKAAAVINYATFKAYYEMNASTSVHKEKLDTLVQGLDKYVPAAHSEEG